MRRGFVGLILALSVFAASPHTARAFPWPVDKPFPPHAPLEVPARPCATPADDILLGELLREWREADQRAEEASIRLSFATFSADQAQGDYDSARTRLDDAQRDLHAVQTGPTGISERPWEGSETEINMYADRRNRAERAVSDAQAAVSKTYANLLAAHRSLVEAMKDQYDALLVEERAGKAFEAELARQLAKKCPPPAVNNAPPPPPWPQPSGGGDTRERKGGAGAGGGSGSGWQAPPQNNNNNAPPAPAPNNGATPQPPPACPGIDGRIADNEAKIAARQRSIASLQKGNVSDPGVQKAIQEEKQTIANLEKQNAALRAQKAACVPPTPQAAPPPTPPAPTSPIKPGPGTSNGTTPNGTTQPQSSLPMGASGTWGVNSGTGPRITANAGDRASAAVKSGLALPAGPMNSPSQQQSSTPSATTITGSASGATVPPAATTPPSTSSGWGATTSSTSPTGATASATTSAGTVAMSGASAMLLFGGTRPGTAMVSAWRLSVSSGGSGALSFQGACPTATSYPTVELTPTGSGAGPAIDLSGVTVAPCLSSGSASAVTLDFGGETSKPPTSGH